MSAVRHTYHPNTPQQLKVGSSLRRTINAFINRFQFRVLRSNRLFAYPIHLTVDPVNRCNLRCPICPSGQHRIARPPGRMEMRTFTRLIEEVGPYLYTLILTNWGEPMLHPRLSEMIRFAKRYNIYVGFSSNFHFLTEDLARNLIRSGLDEIAVSLDGVTAETYRHYRVGGDFDRVLNNVRLFLQVRKQEGGSIPAFRWQFLVHRFNEHEMEAAKRLADELGVDSIMFIPIYLDIDGLFTRLPKERYERDKDWLPRNPEFNMYDAETGRLKDVPEVCPHLWESATVNWDGTVSPCCAVTDPADDFGSVERGSFASVWNNHVYRDARSLMAGRRQPSNTRFVCRFCKQYGIGIR